jgi:hypothetical protein
VTDTWTDRARRLLDIDPDPVVCATAGHYVSTACVDAHRLDRPDLHARCRRTCKHCGALCLCRACTHEGPETPTYDQLHGLLVDTQVDLWSDLNEAVNRAQVTPPVVPGHWSIGCDNVARRIIDNARVVGPVSWRHIQVNLLLGGIYERVLHTAGVAWPTIDWDEVRSLYECIHANADRAVWTGPPVDLTRVYPDWDPT